MSYSEFKTISEICDRFDVIVEETSTLFANVPAISVSGPFQTLLERNIPLANAINTEKARSELLIAPMLLELRLLFQDKIGFFSGSEFNINQDEGLNGYCDFILTASPELYEIRRPVMTLVEAKNENIKGGLAQCMAEMIAASRFNQQENISLPIYGAVTTGMIWQFLRLEGDRSSKTSPNTQPSTIQHYIWLDLREYYIRDADKLMGILAHPFQPYLGDRTPNESLTENP